MATSFDPFDRPTDDALSLFGAEAEPPTTDTVASTVASTVAPPCPLASPSRQTPIQPASPPVENALRVEHARRVDPAAPVDHAPAVDHAPTFSDPFADSLEVVATQRPPGTIGFDQLRDAGGVGFVEGVAAVQALCADMASQGLSSGAPHIHDVFLTTSGEVVASGPPTQGPAPRELARLLHQLVSPDSMPPAGRLFVGRWSSSNSAGLTEFASELAYFARPNGQELLATVYRRNEGAANSAPRLVPQRRVEPERMTPRAPQQNHVQQRDPDAIRHWLRAHRREVAAAVAVLAAVVVTGLAAWFWPAMTPVVAKQAEALDAGTLNSQSAERATASATDSSSNKPSSNSTASNSKASATRNRPGTTPLRGERVASGRNTTLSAPPRVEATNGTTAPDVPILPSGAVPDLRIYSESDSGVEPPTLRSAGIPESLLRGFERRTNAVELIVSERGDVQQVRMLNEPQRMPDIMVLSRVKELRFEPAVRNGVAVRYKMILKWDVTP